MKIIFAGSTGIHHSLLAAQVYIGLINRADHQNMNLWGDPDKEKLGFPHYVGNDQWGNSVYTLGVGAEVPMVVKSIEQLVGILDCSERDLIVTPLYIKRERLLLFLHKLGRSKILNRILIPLIGRLLRTEFTFIRQQVEDFEKTGRACLDK